MKSEISYIRSDTPTSSTLFWKFIGLHYPRQPRLPAGNFYRQIFEMNIIILYHKSFRDMQSFKRLTMCYMYMWVFAT